jgi:hypothetical protein
MREAGGRGALCFDWVTRPPDAVLAFPFRATVNGPASACGFPLRAMQARAERW